MNELISLFTSAIVFGTVILFGATGEILTEKSGNLNLGVPGIMYLGGIAGLVSAFFYEANTANPIPLVAVLLSMVCAFAAAALGAAMWIQIILFFAVSGVVLAFLRPFVRKHVTPGLHPTNADRVIGMTCPVTEDIDNIAGTGTVSADGKIWTARSADGQILEPGTVVCPIRIEGVKLIVLPAEEKAVGTAENK